MQGTVHRALHLISAQALFTEFVKLANLAMNNENYSQFKILKAEDTDLSVCLEGPIQLKASSLLALHCIPLH